MPDPYTILHVGFHKTGANGLHAVLDNNSDRLAQHGIHAVHHRHMRKNFTAPCQQNSGSGKQNVMGDKRLSKITGRFFNQISKSGADRLILTDQNLAGSSRPSIKTGHLYRHCDTIMRVVAGQIPISVNEVHVVVRNYADYFAANYAEYVHDLKKTDIDFLPPRAMCDTVFKRLAGWDDAVKAIRRRFPESRVMLWRFEDLNASNPETAPLLQHLIGDHIAVQTLDHGIKKQPRLALSAQTMGDIELLMRTDKSKAGAKTLRDLLKNREDSEPFDPWLAWERDHLTRLYQDDIVRLGTDKGITLMQSA